MSCLMCELYLMYIFVLLQNIDCLEEDMSNYFSYGMHIMSMQYPAGWQAQNWIIPHSSWTNSRSCCLIQSGFCLIGRTQINCNEGRILSVLGTTWFQHLKSCKIILQLCCKSLLIWSVTCLWWMCTWSVFILHTALTQSMHMINTMWFIW